MRLWSHFETLGRFLLFCKLTLSDPWRTSCHGRRSKIRHSPVRVDVEHTLLYGCFLYVKEVVEVTVMVVASPDRKAFKGRFPVWLWCYFGYQ